MGCCSSKETNSNTEVKRSSTIEALKTEIDDDTTTADKTPRNKRSQTMPKLPRMRSRGFSSIDRGSSSRLKNPKAKSANPTPKNVTFSPSKRLFKKFLTIPLRQHFSTIKKRLYESTDCISLVIDKRAGIKNVIKEIKKSTIPEYFYDDFVLEVQKFLSIDHPNIVKLYNVYDLGDSLFLAYEYLSGLSLADKAHQESISYSLANRLMRDILSGLNLCHQNGIIHLGINFGKIYVNSKEGNIFKLLGFTYPWEIKKKIKENKVTCYMAPEVLDGNHKQYNSDIWSLGVILYTIVQGKSPYKGNKIMDLKDEYTKVIDYEGSQWEFTSKDLKDLISKMLIYDYKKRITAADALNHPWIINSTF